MERDSFVFYKSFYDAINELPLPQQLEAYKAICGYALEGMEPQINGVAKAIFLLVRPQIDANNKRYENGKKGGRKANTNEAETDRKQVENEQKDYENHTESKEILSKDEILNKNKTRIKQELNKNQNLTKPKPVFNQTETDNKPNDNQYLTEAKPNDNDNENDNDNVNDNVLPPIPPTGAEEGVMSHGGGQKTQEEQFACFWENYPKKKSKGQAEKAWAKIKPDTALFTLIMDAVSNNKAENPNWKKQNGQYIPYPATWLNAKGWLDEIKEQRGAAAQNLCMHRGEELTRAAYALMKRENKNVLEAAI